MSAIKTFLTNQWKFYPICYVFFVFILFFIYSIWCSNRNIWFEPTPPPTNIQWNWMLTVLRMKAQPRVTASNIPFTLCGRRCRSQTLTLQLFTVIFYSFIYINIIINICGRKYEESQCPIIIWICKGHKKHREHSWMFLKVWIDIYTIASCDIILAMIRVILNWSELWAWKLLWKIKILKFLDNISCQWNSTETSET